MQILSDKTVKYIGSILLLPFLSTNIVFCQINVTYDMNSQWIRISIEKLKQIIKDVRSHDIQHPSENGIYVLCSETKTNNRHFSELIEHNIKGIQKEGFRIRRTEKDKICIFAIDETGCMYGIQDITEQMRDSPKLKVLKEKIINPAFGFRAIKFNLPWSPYRPGPATDLHMETCRDLNFWESFLDVMVENRFNVISLWNTHPFPYMIRAHNYPQATHLDDKELTEWQHFWKALFRMAKDRGLETYIVNWNIVVSPEFAEAYGADVHNDRSELVKKYTRESVIQVINEYENLTGLGVTLADWMGNWGEKGKMTPTEREDWIEDTFVAGMKAANRPVKFIHRAVLAGDPMEMRRVIDNADLPDQTIVEVKFNWSHGHSTPRLSLTHSNDSGTIMRGFWDPKPDNYFIAWMIRNEDFFVLRWGNPDFIRKHISTNHHEYVNGYFIGSEGYIPAKDYSHVDHLHKTWKYAYQKQWLFYQLWGRLTYNPNLPDQFFESSFDHKYGPGIGKTTLKAMSLASTVPLKIASFYKGTWDFTLYSEGFLAAWQAGYDDQVSPFISVNELIRHKTLDQSYLCIEDFVHIRQSKKDIADNKVTPLELADEVERNCSAALKLVKGLRTQTEERDKAFNSELDDIATWANLGLYFADKLRGGVALATFYQSKKTNEKEKAVNYLEKCVDHWQHIVRLTESRYITMPYVSMGHHQPRWPEFTGFHWKHFLKEVQRDVEIARMAQ
ncbi:MAG: hypothetical protein ACYTFW_05760 [Planctomycetota bacterium]|jgi:hypothetical protein